MTLRERCAAFLAECELAITADDLFAFVLAERGRAADPRLEDSLPLILYLASEADREEVVEAFRAAKPNAITRRMP